MQIYTHTLPGGAQLIGYLRDRTVEMPAFNTRPAILILPGGGYAWCSRREADPVAMQFLQAGYNVFTLDYTCRSDETVPALRWQPLIDAAGAILHIRRNAEQFGTDPAKIAICGFSAGGHLAASTAILWDAEPVQKALGIHADGSPPRCCCAGLPSYHVGHHDRHGGSIKNLCGDDAELKATMSLENQIRGRSAALLYLAHGGGWLGPCAELTAAGVGALTEPIRCRLSCISSTTMATAPAPARGRSTPPTPTTAPGWISCTDWLAETSSTITCNGR